MSDEAPLFEARDLDCRCYDTDADFWAVLAKDKPVVIVSVGDQKNFPNILSAPFYIKKRWMHIDNPDSLSSWGQQVFMCFLDNVIKERHDVPLVSVFTPSFRTGHRIWKPYTSLLSQTYVDWEWVIVDDSDDDGATFKMLSEMASNDARIRVYRESQHSGKIGNVKKTACNLSRGEFLVELDHDDELTPKALDWVVQAFEAYPEAGFVYTDSAECGEDGSPVMYPPGWGFGYGKYRAEVHGGITYQVIVSPNINPKTIRHIVAAPNHIRAWRKSVYDSIGGHNPLLHVADDYELMVRTFLHTRMVHIPRLGYVQYRNENGNTSLGVRNKDIQRLVRYISCAYDKDIHNRFIELGIDDYLWEDGTPSFFRLGKVPNPEVEQHCSLVFEPQD